MDVPDALTETEDGDVCVSNWSDVCNMTKEPHDLVFVGEAMSMTSLVILGSLHGVSIVNGVLGNGLLLVALLTDKPFRTLSKTYSVYLVNLALADLYLLAYYYPMLLLGFVLGRYPAHNHTHCVLTAFLASVSYQAFLMTLLLISLDRFVRVRYNRFYRSHFSRRNGTVACVATWIISSIAVMPMLKAGSFGFNPKLHSCQLTEATKALFYNQMLLVIEFVLVITGYAVLNILIYRTIRQTRQRRFNSLDLRHVQGNHEHSTDSSSRHRVHEDNGRVQETGTRPADRHSQCGDMAHHERQEDGHSRWVDNTHMPDRVSSRPNPERECVDASLEPRGGTYRYLSDNTSRSNDTTGRQRQRVPSLSDLALLRSVLAVFVCMIVCLAPMGVVRVLEKYVDVPVDVYAVCMWLLSANSSLSWIVYGLTNARFRYSYKRALSRCRLRSC